MLPYGEVWRRADLARAGWSNGRIHRALVSGRLVRVARDRYVAPGHVPEVARVVALPGSATALTHGSALRVWGVPVSDDVVRVLVPHGCRRTALPPGVVVHQSRDWLAEEVDGVLVVSAAQALADHLRTAPLIDGVIAADAALRLGLVEREEVARLLERPAPGRGRARRALALADPRSESPLETQLRVLLVLAGVPPEAVQHVVREHGRFVARVDLWYWGVAVEADGFEFHRHRADYLRDRRKGQAFARCGLLVLRFGWEDVVARPDEVVATVRATLAARLTAA